jgi:hypothetical protein
MSDWAGLCPAGPDFVQLSWTFSGRQFQVGKPSHHWLVYETRLAIYSRAEQDYEIQNRTIYKLESN